MVDKEDLRQQFTEAFEGADYPVNSPMDLVPALPQGPGTTFESGDFSMTAMELNTKAVIEKSPDSNVVPGPCGSAGTRSIGLLTG